MCPTCLEPLESKTWLCRKCNAHLERSEAIEIVKKAYRESQNLLENPNQWHIDTFETFLSNFSQILHVNHLTNVAVKSKLVGFYGKEPGYTLGEMSKEMLQKKLKYGQDCLEVLKKIQPGLSSAKGKLRI